MTRKHGIARNTLALLAANGLSSVFGLVRGFYIARFLLPGDYGLYSLIVALLSYANYADAGINTGMILEVPKLIGQRHLDEAQRVQRQAYTATLIVTGILAIVLMAVSYSQLMTDPQQAMMVRITGMAALGFGLLNYYNLAVRIQERFMLISISVVITAMISFCAIIGVGLIVQNQRLEAMALASLTGPCAAALFLGRENRAPLIWSLDLRIIRNLVKIGLPISLVPIAFTLFHSVDRWVVAASVPAADLGYYGIGTTIGVFLYMLPSTLAYILFTKQIARFAATGDPKASEPLVSSPLLFSGYIMAAVSGVITIAIPFILYYIIPVYLPGTRAAIFQIIGNCLLFSVPVASNFLISTGRYRQVFGALAAAMIVEAGLVFVLVRTVWGIEGAALAVLISDVIYGGLLAFLAVRLFGGTLPRQLVCVARYFLPFAICLPVALWLLNAGPLSGALWGDLGRLSGRIIIFVLICGPLCLLAAWASNSLKQMVAYNK